MKASSLQTLLVSEGIDTQLLSYASASSTAFWEALGTGGFLKQIQK